MKITLDSQGRILLPHQIQTQLGVKPGDELILESHNGQCTIRRDCVNTGLSWKGNVLVHQGSSNDDSDAILAEIRDSRLNKLCEGEAE